MSYLVETFILLILIMFYWLNPGRRKKLKKKYGKNDFQHLRTIAHNLRLMLIADTEFVLQGDCSLINKGAVLYSFHFGVWELMPRILSKNTDKELGVLVNRYTDNNIYFLGRIMDRLLYWLRSKNHIRIFYPDEVFKIVNFVKNGGIFAALVDGDTFYDKYEKIERIACLCKVPLIPFVVYYEKGKVIMQMGCNPENMVKSMPEHYWWFYRSRRLTEVQV